MTITISLPPETEQKLRQCVAQTGQSVEGFVQRLVERAVRHMNGEQTVALQGTLPSDEALAPFRREVAESGMTDEELFDFFEEVREEIYQEKHGRPSKVS